MPALVTVIGTAIRVLMGYAITKALFTLGVGYVVYVGMEQLFEGVESYISSSYSGMPAAMIQILGIMGVDRAITIILSAVSMRLLISGHFAAGGALAFAMRRNAE